MRFLKAERIFNGQVFLPGNPILVLDQQGILRDLLPENAVEDGRIEKLKGNITPGFVNSHCHLELSHLRGKIPQHIGLPAFGKQVILQRNNFAQEEIAEHLKDANTAMWQNGIVVVGDISNGANSFKEKADSNIYYHTFVELIGLNPAAAETVFNQGLLLLENLTQLGLSGSLAPHAPYSTSTQLIEKIAKFDFNKRTPFSIHNQESEEETKFMMGEKSGFDELYQFLNLDLSWYKAPRCSALKSYVEGLSDAPSLLVHNRLTDRSDIELTASKNIFWCFCPHANLYIDNKLPEFKIFANHKNKICLGTDSLASNDSLNLLREANVVLSVTKDFTAEDLLRAITYNAAEALGVSDRFGSLLPGKNSGLNLVETHNGEIRFIKKLI